MGSEKENMRCKLISYCNSRIKNLSETQIPKIIREFPENKRELRRRLVIGRIRELRHLKAKLSQEGIDWLFNKE